MKRFITGILLACIIFSILLLEMFTVGWVFFLIGCGFALYEYYTMVLSPGEMGYKKISIFLGLLILASSYGGSLKIIATVLTLVIIALCIIVLVRYTDLQTKTPDQNVAGFLARVVFGFIYIGFFASHVMLTFKLPSGAYWLVILFLITGMSDTCAYYTGHAFGKHKLCPAISPGKTVEGLLGGIVGATAAAIALAAFLFPHMHFLTVGIIAVLTTCMGVIGDLLESVIKRSMHVKDSGSALPGHGGLLDRMDSILVSAPLFFYMIIYIFPEV